MLSSTPRAGNMSNGIGKSDWHPTRADEHTKLKTDIETGVPPLWPSPDGAAGAAKEDLNDIDNDYDEYSNKDEEYDDAERDEDDGNEYDGTICVPINLGCIKVADAQKHGPRPINNSTDAWRWSNRYRDFIQKGDDGKILRYAVFQRPGETLDLRDPDEDSDRGSSPSSRPDSSESGSASGRAHTKSISSRGPRLSLVATGRDGAPKRQGNKVKGRKAKLDPPDVNLCDEDSAENSLRGTTPSGETEQKQQLPSTISANKRIINNVFSDAEGRRSTDSPAGFPNSEPRELLITPSKTVLDGPQPRNSSPLTSPRRAMSPGIGGSPRPTLDTGDGGSRSSLYKRRARDVALDPTIQSSSTIWAPRPASGSWDNDASSATNSARGRTLQRHAQGSSSQDGLVARSRESLSMESMVLTPSSSTSPASPPYLEPLDMDFQVVQYPKRFYNIGRIFMTVWFQPGGRDLPRTRSAVQWQKKCPPFRDTKPDAGFRWFVVVRKRADHSLCLNITTLAASAAGRDTDHCVLHSALVDAPQPADGENIQVKPIAVIVEHAKRFISPMARLDLSRIYTVEHSLSVMKLGRVHPGSLPTLEEHYKRAVR